MNKALALVLLLAGCATPGTATHPRQQLSAHVVNPSCLFICYTRVTVEDNDGGTDSPEQEYSDAP